MKGNYTAEENKKYKDKEKKYKRKSSQKSRKMERKKKQMQLQKQSNDIVKYSLGKSARECKLTLKDQTKVMLWKHSFATGNMF